MASIPPLNALSCKTLPKTYKNSNFMTWNAFHFINGTSFPGRWIKKSTEMKRRLLRVESHEGDSGPYLALIETVVEKERPMKTEVLKKQLVDSFYGTNGGLSASSETRAEVAELIARLEAENPTPAPSEALDLLHGKWILAYTSFVGLFHFLSRNGTFPFPEIEEISQTIDSENFTVQNSVLFSGPLTTTSISTNATFEVRSPKRVQIKFEEGIIGTPQLTDSVLLPEKMEFLGHNIDLTPFKDFLTSAQDTANSLANAVSSQPPLKFPISDDSYRESWLLTTYLDDELRISRDDGGRVFVLVKVASPLLKP